MENKFYSIQAKDLISSPATHTYNFAPNKTYNYLFA